MTPQQNQNITESKKTDIPGHQSLLILVGIVLGVLMGALDNLIVSTAMPAIVSALHQPKGLPFLIDAYITSSAVGMVIFGRLSDHYSKKSILIITLAIFISGSIFAGMSQNISQLILFRAIQGLGAGGFLPVGLAVIAVILPPKARARITGIVTSFIGIAIVAGPEVGAYIVNSTSWRWVFYVNIPFGALSMIILISILGRLKPKLVEKFDTLGAILLTVWVSLLIFPLVEMVYSGWRLSDPLTILFLSLALLSFFFFLYVETRIAPAPLIPIRMFKRKTITADSFLSFFRGGVIFSLSTFIAIFVTEVLVGTADTLRDVLYGFVVPMVVGSIAGGMLLPKFSYRTLCVAGMVLMTLGFVPLMTISPATQPYIFFGPFPVFGLVEGLIPIGFGIGFTMSGTTISAQYSTEPRDIGASTSIVQFMGNIGGSVILSTLTVFLYLKYKSLNSISTIRSVKLNQYGINEIAMSSAMSESFFILLILSLVAVICAFFIEGHLPVVLQKK